MLKTVAIDVSKLFLLTVDSDACMHGKPFMASLVVLMPNPVAIEIISNKLFLLTVMHAYMLNNLLHP